LAAGTLVVTSSFQQKSPGLGCCSLIIFDGRVCAVEFPKIRREGNRIFATFQKQPASSFKDFAVGHYLRRTTIKFTSAPASGVCRRSVRAES
jgi:hypothetical protein